MVALQNARLAAAPVAVFATSLVVEGAGVSVAALALAGCWMLITVWALNTHSLEMGPAERPSMSALEMSSGNDGRRPSPKIPKAMPVSDRMYQVRRRSLWASAA